MLAQCWDHHPHLPRLHQLQKNNRFSLAITPPCRISCDYLDCWLVSVHKKVLDISYNHPALRERPWGHPWTSRAQQINGEWLTALDASITRKCYGGFRTLRFYACCNEQSLPNTESASWALAVSLRKTSSSRPRTIYASVCSPRMLALTLSSRG